MSAGFVGRILAGVTVAGYGIYAFVLIGVLAAHRMGRLLPPRRARDDPLYQTPPSG